MLNIFVFSRNSTMKMNESSMDEVTFVAKIRKVGATSLGITIKKEIVELLDLRPGMLVEVTIKKLQAQKRKR